MAESEALLSAWSASAPPEGHAWQATVPGPALAAVAARMASVPRSFLDPRVSVAALAGDVVRQRLLSLDHESDDRVRRGAAVGLWLVASEDLVEPFTPSIAAAAGVGRAIDALALRLAPVVDPWEWLSDDERREEAVRTFLLWAGMRPAEEDVDTARSLLDARDSLRRNAALAQAYAAHRHRDEIARRLAEARAKEAAARYSSE
ncbi:hypothetical protein [Microbacterium oleivorans]|uniref:Putative phosphohydrolase n=1 Tax=Microbacterium oleivorans TaxID=273677 RepID=A0A031FWN0_9MICO|nr:hypothetical protein [Microbacterium oleivorans]EZP28040.1 putative phosphohydrolase [Microbacterium oleivorans]THE06001.1 phosphohydrolase [Microbacterium oleivorans]